jgi:hypothetical protein
MGNETGRSFGMYVRRLGGYLRLWLPSLLHVLQKNATGSVATIAISIVAIDIASVDIAIAIDIASVDIGMLPLSLLPL